MKNKTLDPETPDQKRLRAVAEKIKTILDAEELGGTFAICSTESTEWLIHLPKWVGIEIVENKVSIHVSSRDPEKMENTMAFLASMRDVANDFGRVFTQIFATMRDRIRENGGYVEHYKWGGRGHGPAGPTDGSLN